MEERSGNVWKEKNERRGAELWSLGDDYDNPRHAEFTTDLVKTSSRLEGNHKSKSQIGLRRREWTR